MNSLPFDVLLVQRDRLRQDLPLDVGQLDGDDRDREGLERTEAAARR